MLNNVKLYSFIVCQLVLGALFIHLYNSSPSPSSSSTSTASTTPRPSTTTTPVPHISPHVQLFDLNQTTTNQSFRCIESKPLLNYVKTHVCLYDNDKDIFVSGSFRGQDSIWEEGGVKLMLELLLRHPHLDFIDIGANVGTYTMYVAALGRFVLAIDCFRPNLERLRRAIQLRNVGNRVVLVANALYTSSGKSLRLNPAERNVGGQSLETSPQNQTMPQRQDDPYVVRTIQFDDVLPILVDRQVRGALLKMDIEGSESFVVESGGRVFDTIDIPYVMMEWMNVRKYPDRVKVILDFFNKRQYEARSLSCQLLNQGFYQTWPGDICWMRRNVSNFC